MKFTLFVKNLWFYITNYFRIKKKARLEKEETLKVEKQAKRILESDTFSQEHIEW